MKVSSVKGLANQDDPESCVARSNPRGEALTGDGVGWVLSREKEMVWDADPVDKRGRPQPRFRIGEEHWYAVKQGRHKAAVPRLCWLTSTSTTCLTSGCSTGARQRPKA